MIPYEHEGIQHIRHLSQFCRNACQFNTYLVVQQENSALPTTGLLGDWEQDSDVAGSSTYPIMMQCVVERGCVKIQASFSLEAVVAEEMNSLIDTFCHVLQLLSREDHGYSTRKLDDIERMSTPGSELACPQMFGDPRSTGQPCSPSTSSTMSTASTPGTPGTPSTAGSTSLISTIGDNEFPSLGPHPEADGETGCDASRHPDEKAVALQKIWAAALGLSISEVGLDESFFSLGGDSIAAMKVAAAARIAGWNISVSTILKFPTITQQVTQSMSWRSPEPVVEVPLPYTLVSTGLRREILQSFQRKGVKNKIVDILPTTDFQNRVVKESVLDHRTALNYATLDLEPSVDITKLQEACNTLVEHVEILRTVFVYTQGRAWQVVLDSLPIILSQIGVQDHGAIESHNLASSPTYKDLFDHPPVSFALAQGPTTVGRHRLIIGISHAQYDGLSIPMILRVLECAYWKQPLPALIPFSAFSLLQSSQQSSSASYWRTLLESSKLTRALSTISPGLVPEQEPQQKEFSRTLTLPVVPDGATVSLMANLAWALTLQKLTGRDDIVYVTLVAGRSTPARGIESILGPCLNLVPVRLKFPSSWTVPGLLGSLQDQFASMGRADTMGIDDIQEQCTDWPQSTTFDAIFFHQNVDETPEHHLSGRPTKAHLQLNPLVALQRSFVTTYQEGEKLSVRVSTSSHLVNDSGVEVLLDDFQKTLSLLSDYEPIA